MSATYKTSFTAAALVPEETLQVVERVRDSRSLDAIGPDLLNTNSYSGRRRKMSEIKRRLEATPRSTWEDFTLLSTAEQHIVLYYCCLRTHQLLFDVHMEVVLPKWRSLERSLRPHDVRRYLEQRSETHAEIDDWSSSTWNKVSQVIRKMLGEAGLLKEGRLEAVQLSPGFWKRFVTVGDVWFLEACFLNESQRDAVIKAARS